ncbi:unnamed protein product [Cladocopium goreaui]|uniref:Uncharacterized protein n=1 Tax=Cladocopium goreaui TaxID=2562237 RepID=A0A9P1CXM6_9DINO|nr:unnamed protein product [Cladocopium goreaui]
MPYAPAYHDLPKPGVLRSLKEFSSELMHGEPGPWGVLSSAFRLQVVRVVDQVLLVMVPHQATWESDGCDMQRLRSGVAPSDKILVEVAYVAPDGSKQWHHRLPVAKARPDESQAG